MRTFLIAVVLFWSVDLALAARRPIKPTDFAPLTSLPWKETNATLAFVLDRIFLETNTRVRSSILAEYLRIIPAGQLGEAFDRCLELEGSETPDNLVSQILPIWAERDPKGCWQRTQRLSQLVVNEGWLGFDSWKQRPRIKPVNVNALRTSPFRLNEGALKGFPIGIEQSSLPPKERMPFLQGFAALWFRDFESWPGYHPTYQRFEASPDRDSFANGISRVFAKKLDQIRELDMTAVSYSDVAFEIALRRWMQAEPAAGAEILKKAAETILPPKPGYRSPSPAGPSNELLMIWAKADLPGMIKWAEPLELHKSELARKVKGFLMCRVDEMTRNRWLAEAKAKDPNEDVSENLWEAWMEWEPDAALEATITTKNIVGIRQLSRAPYGPWSGQPYNGSHFGIGVINDLDITRLRGELFQEIDDWYMMMEQWGDIDIGEAARFGYKFLGITGYASREGLIRFFGGEDIYPGEDGMIDRTFCALRMWAVVNPTAMKKWIATLDDAEMRTALTWLLNNPWGGPDSTRNTQSAKRARPVKR